MCILTNLISTDIDQFYSLHTVRALSIIKCVPKELYNMVNLRSISIPYGIITERISNLQLLFSLSNIVNINHVNIASYYGDKKVLEHILNLPHIYSIQYGYFQPCRLYSDISELKYPKEFLFKSNMADNTNTKCYYYIIRL